METAEGDVQAGLQAYFAPQGVTVTGLYLLARGWESDVYGFSAAGGEIGAAYKLVLRLYTGANAARRPHDEVYAMKRLHALGYPVPELVAFEPSGASMGSRFLVMAYVDGRPMWQHFRPHYFGPEMLNLFCDLLFGLHQLDGHQFVGAQHLWKTADGGVGTFAIEFLSGLLREVGLEEEFGPLFERLAVWEQAVQRDRRCLIHGDFHSENILMTAQGSPFVIDWSSAALDDPRVDVAQAVVLETTNGRPEIGHLIKQRYEALAGAPLRDFDFFEVLALARRLASIVIAMSAGAGFLGMRPGLEAELKQRIPRTRSFTDLLSERTGVPLDRVQQVLTRLET